MDNPLVSVIIPELVTFSTKVKKLRGFNLSEKFDFYKKSKNKSKFHYNLIISNNIIIPKSYEFRNGYYFKSDNCWYYERKILPGISLKFKFNPDKKTFYFNRLYSLIPFEIGGIIPVGKHISDFINLKLFLNDFIIFFGSSYIKDNETICIIAPSYNGKTTLVKNELKEGGRYISEDMLIINFNENKVYPSSPRLRNYFRKINKNFLKLNDLKIIDYPSDFNEVYLYQNSSGLKKDLIKKKNLFEYFLLNSLFFFNNKMIKTFIIEEGLTEDLMKKIDNIKKIKKYNFVRLNNFKKIGK